MGKIRRGWIQVQPERAMTERTKLTEHTVAQVMRRVPAMSLEDSLMQTASLLEQHQCSALPVVANGRLLGLVEEQQVTEVLAEISRDGHRETPRFAVRDVVRTTPTLPDSATLDEALAVFREQGCEALPVVNAEGAYEGLLIRHDVLETVHDWIRPPLVGGMATPLGVHLTTGSLRGGVGDWALGLTGLMMVGLGVLAYALIFCGAWTYDGWAGTAYHLGLLSDLLASSGGLKTFLRLVEWGLWPLALLLLLHWSNLALYHAAEHQVVHALERGLPLRPETVQAMPRAHPRCGTNLFLVIYLVLMNVAQVYLYQVDWKWVAPSLLLLLVRKRIGAFLQNVLMTRRASEGAIESGIRAAEELTARYRENPSYRASLPRRVWNRGLLQVLLGMLAGSGLVKLGWQVLNSGLELWLRGG